MFYKELLNVKQSRISKNCNSIAMHAVKEY
jgi:hypothetical protein